MEGYILMISIMIEKDKEYKVSNEIVSILTIKNLQENNC